MSMEVGSALSRVTTLADRLGNPKVFEAAYDGSGLAARADSLANEIDDALGSARVLRDGLEESVRGLEVKVAELSAGPVDALDGANLLVLDDTDAVIGALSGASTQWSMDLIPKEAARIEAQLRSRKIMNTEAATLLGQPIAVAAVPISPDAIAKSGKTVLADIPVVPDGILSPAEGYAAQDDAIKAALDHLATSSDSTLIGIEDSRGATHLLTANMNTSPRTTQQHYGFKGRKVRNVTTEVDVRAAHDNVHFIVRSDNTTIKHPDIKTTTWPEGHHTPITPTELQNTGLSQRYTSELTKTKNELEATKTQLEALTTAANRLGVHRTNISEAQRFASIMQSIAAPAGKGSPQAWNLNGLFITVKSRGNIVHPEYDDRLMGMFQHFSETPLEDVIAKVKNTLDLPPEDWVAILKASNGDYYATIAKDAGEHFSLVRAAEDLQAVVVGDYVHYPIKGGKWAHTPIPSVLNSHPAVEAMKEPGLRELSTGAKKRLFTQIERHFVDAKSHWGRFIFDPISRPENPVMVLKSREISSALTEAQGLLEAANVAQRKAAVVGVQTQDQETFFVLVHVRKLAAGGKTKSLPRKHGWARLTEPHIVGLFDQHGVVFQRPLDQIKWLPFDG